jgi:nucleotide-binding universal stress UspA family protein
MKTIVVGYDGSDAAERALRRAADIADAFCAGLVVVGVSGYGPAPVSALESSPELVPPAVAGPVAPAGTVQLPEPVAARPEPEELARRQLERARMSLASRKVETECVVELGDSAERLLGQVDRPVFLLSHAVPQRRRGGAPRLRRADGRGRPCLALSGDTFRPERSIKGSIPTARCGSCKWT